jgi:hypothetical protein
MIINVDRMLTLIVAHQIKRLDSTRTEQKNEWRLREQTKPVVGGQT